MWRIIQQVKRRVVIAGYDLAGSWCDKALLTVLIEVALYTDYTQDIASSRLAAIERVQLKIV